MNRNRTKSAVITALMLLVMPFSLAMAQSNSVLDTPNVPGSSDKNPLVTCDGVEKKCEYRQFVGLIQNILSFIFAIAAFIAAGMFMYAGFLLITAAGDPGQINRAKGVFKRVIVGFLIMFLAFVGISELLKRLALSDEARKIIEGTIKF